MYNRWLSLLGILFRYALENEQISVDPMSGIRRVKERGEGSRTWSEEEIAQYEAFWPIGSRQRLAFALMLYTGQRRSDAVKMGPNDIWDGFLDVIQQKTGARLSIPIHPALAEILATEPLTGGTYLRNQAGHQASSNGLGNQFRAWADAAGVSGDLSGHGLRKAAARRLAEAGCTPHQIAAITGHKTLSEIERYTRAVDQKKLAEEAMQRVVVLKPRDNHLKTVNKKR
ncbi:tyrosine-type recombinase/integrase [Asaia bogorensis]|uniref:tyrosine-type recombinase/integrase n=1 Tax=Asaia bogorensis TaxID=91915 RepID=UPI0013C514A6|nr:tyrosine-type recombinase/integrase [Asaia bogorensis]